MSLGLGRDDSLRGASLSREPRTRDKMSQELGTGCREMSGFTNGQDGRADGQTESR